jgi:hypothetical protein
MRRTSVISLIVVALGAGVAMERPAQGMYGDILILATAEPSNPAAPVVSAQADPPNVWVPADNIVATWESLTALSKLFNPAQHTGPATERSLSLSVRVDVIDVNGLLGFDSAERGILVLDEKPRVFHSKAPPERYCHFYWPLRYIKKMPTPGQWVDELQPYKFTVDMPLDPNRPYPLVLSRVEWSMYALVNTESKTVDVPFVPVADWVTLTPGVEIKVEQATAEAGKYQYRLATRYTRSKVLWAPGGAAISIWTHEPTPEVIVTKMDILDVQGKPVSSGSGGSASSGGGSSSAGSGDLVTGTTSGSGSFSSGAVATTLRFTLALKPQQQQLRFILENVPVPLL